MNEVYSPGLEGVIAGETAISTVTGGLEYRGYSVEELARRGTFEEVAYLLLYGELPSGEALAAFRRRIGDNMMLPNEIVATLRAIPRNAPMMDVMRTGASMIAHWDAEVGDNSREANLRKAERLLAQLPIVMATRHRIENGMDPVAADPSRSIAVNILRMISGETPPMAWEHAMDVSLILYAEHEFNASTFTARVVASTLADLHSAVVAAIGALKGPLHGGANERVLEVLQAIGPADRAEGWIRDALAKKVRIMGFGHRVYKDGDPRAVLLKEICKELAATAGQSDMEQIAETIETAVRSAKNLPPNLDWPSARLYHYLNLPVNLYTPLFVVSRVVGWSAHIIEQLDNNRLIRPRGRYTGPASRSWLAIKNRR